VIYSRVRGGPSGAQVATAQAERLGRGRPFRAVEDYRVRGLADKFGIAGELMAFLWSQRLWWMIPLVTMLLLIAALVAFASATALAPFIYPLI
jgi:hypothetical protein